VDDAGSNEWKMGGAHNYTGRKYGRRTQMGGGEKGEKAGVGGTEKGKREGKEGRGGRRQVGNRSSSVQIQQANQEREREGGGWNLYLLGEFGKNLVWGDGGEAAHMRRTQVWHGAVSNLSRHIPAAHSTEYRMEII